MAKTNLSDAELDNISLPGHYMVTTDDATYLVTLRLQLALSNGYDFICHSAELKNVIDKFLNSLDVETGSNPIALRILCFKNVEWSQRLLLSSFYITIETNIYHRPEPLLGFDGFEVTEKYKVIKPFLKF